MKIVVGLALAIALATPTFASDDKRHDAEPHGQTERMRACNKEAHDKQLKGEERRHFMSACLKGDHSRAEKRS